MNVKTARIISFGLSTLALILALVYFTSSNKESMKVLVYVGLGLIIGSMVIRNLIRFKPDWFAQENKKAD